jgi:hypothetical protein
MQGAPTRRALAFFRSRRREEANFAKFQAVRLVTSTATRIGTSLDQLSVAIALSFILTISLGCHNRIRGPQVPVPRETITVIPSIR